MTDAKIVLNKDFIKEEMQRRNIASINEFSRQIGISQSMFHLILNGKRNPGSKAISLMMSYFGVEFEKIFIEPLPKVHTEL
ncbi:helix-turn-helix domain-containing protein [Paenibacillus silvisoli]|uniref:helix-turn-helix domain-containing protein n=1 Tax=Paenibacillus silvisoli TaxID=3110539 RepID=UPI0028046CEB|nr:helix-turn-helix transcriptional regulator [Paenibacillus silvisoli]